MNHFQRFILSIASAMLLISVSAHANANPAHEKLSAMSEPKRRAAMAEFLRESGEHCSNVTKTFYQGSSENGDAFWNASCSGGHSYLIQVKNDATGSTRILDCKVLKAVNAGTCFTKFNN